MNRTYEQSYHYFMNTKLFDHIDIDKSKTHVLKGIDAMKNMQKNMMI